MDFFHFHGSENITDALEESLILEEFSPGLASTIRFDTFLLFAD